MLNNLQAHDLRIKTVLSYSIYRSTSRDVVTPIMILARLQFGDSLIFYSVMDSIDVNKN